MKSRQLNNEAKFQINLSQNSSLCVKELSEDTLGKRPDEKYTIKYMKLPSKPLIECVMFISGTAVLYL